VRADDLLLAHPQVAHVEVEVVARGRAADDDLAERLDDEDEVGKVALPTCSKTTSGASPRISLTRLAKSRETRKRAFSSSGVSPPAAHHAGELVAVDEALGAELLDERALLRGGDDAHALGAARRHSCVAKTPRPPAAPQMSTRWPACSAARSMSMR
jgi:hypothetical protein